MNGTLQKKATSATVARRLFTCKRRRLDNGQRREGREDTQDDEAQVIKGLDEADGKPHSPQSERPPQEPPMLTAEGVTESTGLATEVGTHDRCDHCANA